jgi:hypothetical protein
MSLDATSFRHKKKLEKIALEDHFITQAPTPNSTDC